MAKYQFTVLSFDPKTKRRAYGAFYPTRNKAETSVKYLTKTYPKLRFSVASVKLD